MKKIFFLCIILSSTSILSQLKIKGSFNAKISASTTPLNTNNIDFLKRYFPPLQIEITTFKKVEKNGFKFESSYHFSDIDYLSRIKKSIGNSKIFN